MLEDGLVGRTEREVAIELELRMRRLGAEAPSFPSIVAAGAHGALPHAEPRDEEIPRGRARDDRLGRAARRLLLGLHPHVRDGRGDLASGARGLRARARGPGARPRALRPGPAGARSTRVAREVIEQAGHGEHFGHGLGHGVGLEVHEAPRLSRTAGEEPLREGNVVTVEPGVYLPGELGVRIEDLVVVRAEGAEVLTGLPKELTVIG